MRSTSRTTDARQTQLSPIEQPDDLPVRSPGSGRAPQIISQWHMKLDIREIRLDVDRESAKPRALAGTSLGTFDQFSGTLHSYFEDEWPVSWTIESFLQNLATELASLDTQAARIDRGAELTTMVHEWRHFHDCFMTPVGVQLFEDHVMAYTALGVLANELSTRNPGNS